MNNNEMKQDGFRIVWGNEVVQFGITMKPKAVALYGYRVATGKELAILDVFFAHKYDERRPFPAVETIAKYMNVDKRNIQKSLRDMIKKGLIEVFETFDPVTKMQRSNRVSLDPIIEKCMAIAREESPEFRKEQELILRKRVIKDDAENVDSMGVVETATPDSMGVVETATPGVVETATPGVVETATRRSKEEEENLRKGLFVTNDPSDLVDDDDFNFQDTELEKRKKRLRDYLNKKNLMPIALTRYEEDCLERWSSNSFKEDLVFFAADEAYKKAEGKPLLYMARILDDKPNKGITTREQAEAEKQERAAQYKKPKQQYKSSNKYTNRKNTRRDKMPKCFQDETAATKEPQQETPKRGEKSVEELFAEAKRNKAARENAKMDDRATKEDKPIQKDPGTKKSGRGMKEDEFDDFMANLQKSLESKENAQ